MNPPVDQPPRTDAPRADANNLPPVGDIKLSKVKGTYNTYKLELSMGQIEAIRNALEKDHADPISDELLAIFSYYVEKVPGPGEEEDDLKAREEHPGMAADEEGDFPIPMPPNEGNEAPGDEPPLPPEGGSAAPGGMPEPHGGGGGQEPMPEPGMTEEPNPDEHLPEPPAE
jgi:hypothetical protein